MLSTCTGGALRRDLPRLEDRIRNLAEKGFRRFDLDLYDEQSGSPYLTDDWRERLLPAREALAELGAQARQAHSYGGNPLTEDQDRELQIDARALECCAFLSIPQVVVHPGAYPGITQEEFLEKNRLFYRRLIPDMERTGVNVLIENIGSPGDPYYIRTGREPRLSCTCRAWSSPPRARMLSD